MTADRWSKVLFVIGSVAILVGTLDPMESSIVIMAGSAVLLASVVVGKSPRPVVVYWTWTLVLIAVGVGTLFAWSSVGGLGGRTGHSMWWGLTMLPYPIGWFMAVRAIVRSIIDSWRARHAVA